MEAIGVNWTDDRLDHLSQRMDERFDHVDERFRQIDERFKQVDERFKQVDERFRQVDERFNQVDKRFDRIEVDMREMRSELNLRFEGMQRTLMQIGGGVIVALLGLIATQV